MTNIDHDILNVENTEELLEKAIISAGFTPQLYKQMEARREIFWKNLRNQYFESLRFSEKNTPDRPGIVPKEGDIVIIYADNNRLFWKKGIIMKLIKSTDGLVRKPVVKVGSIESVKAISHLYSLECRAQDNIDNYRTKKGFRGSEESQEEKVKNETRMKALKNVRSLLDTNLNNQKQ